MLKFICLYCYININTYICYILINKSFRVMEAKERQYKERLLKELKSTLFAWNVVTIENRETYDKLCKEIKDLTKELNHQSGNNE